MRRTFLPILVLVFLVCATTAQTAPTPAPATTAKPAPAPAVPAPLPSATPELRAPAVSTIQASLDRLTQSNHDLLDLLKKQQSVLEDIQYDRRLQSRQIQSLEARLQETLFLNAQLQNKIDNLANAAAVNPVTTAPQGGNVTGVTTTPQPSPTKLIDAPPPPPSTYLPAPESEGAPGTLSWHRLFTLSGSDGKDSEIFQIKGRLWRVRWHNQDKPGKAYLNTSALFISAFPKDDTIPQKVCAKLGSGGDSTELTGTGNYYLKIEASGGAWELAVEDFR